MRGGGGGGSDVEGVTLNTVNQSNEANQDGGAARGKAGSKNANKKCYACGKMGHISYKCPEENKREESHNTNTTVQGRGNRSDGKLPSQVAVSEPGGGDDSKSTGSSLLGSIPLKKNMALCQKRCELIS